MEYFGANPELREFSKSLPLIVMPSTLWAVHIDPEYNFIVVLHVQVKSLSKLNIDKGILITFNTAESLINVSFFIHNQNVHIPALSSSIKSISDLSNLIYIVHNLRVCTNADKYLDYPQCNKYIEFERYETLCQSCLWLGKKENKTSNGLWKDLTDIQNLHYTNSESSNEAAADNLIEENSLCCSNIDDHQAVSGKKTELNDPNLTEMHILTTTEAEESPDTYCDKSADVKSHKPKHNRRCFSCEYCNKSFLSKTHLQEHLRTHTGEKPFLCEICNKASSRRSIHQRHVLTHSNTKPNLCNICGKTFCHGYRMKDHLLTHSSERPFKCEVCHKAFAKSYNLRLHQKTHSGVRPFICSSCGKTYTTQSNLATHVRSAHTNKKPHACTSCHMTFVHPRYLRIHMRKHTGEKPYKCVICGKTFAKNIHLTIHMRMHTGEKPHICTVCRKGFTTTGNLSSHRRVHHKDLDSAIK